MLLNKALLWTDLVHFFFLWNTQKRTSYISLVENADCIPAWRNFNFNSSLKHLILILENLIWYKVWGVNYRASY